MPYCRDGILAGTVLSFARALGEYGATSMFIGYTPGRTATISTTVYQLWREGNEALEFEVELIDVKPYVAPAPADSLKTDSLKMEVKPAAVEKK